MAIDLETGNTTAREGLSQTISKLDQVLARISSKETGQETK